MVSEGASRERDTSNYPQHEAGEGKDVANKILDFTYHMELEDLGPGKRR